MPCTIEKKTKRHEVVRNSNKPNSLNNIKIFFFSILNFDHKGHLYSGAYSSFQTLAMK